MPRGRIPFETNFKSPRRAFVIVLITVVVVVTALCIGGTWAYRTWIAPQTELATEHVTGKVTETVRTSQNAALDVQKNIEERAQTAQKTIEDIREKKNRLKVFFTAIINLFSNDTSPTP